MGSLPWDGLAQVWQLLLFQDGCIQQGRLWWSQPMEYCQLGESWKSRDDTEPSHPALHWGPSWSTLPWVGVRAPSASLSSLPEDGGTGLSGTQSGAGLEPCGMSLAGNSRASPGHNHPQSSPVPSMGQGNCWKWFSFCPGHTKSKPHTETKHVCEGPQKATAPKGMEGKGVSSGPGREEEEEEDESTAGFNPRTSGQCGSSGTH